MDIGLIVDLETTGTDPQKDQVVEVGLIEFGVTTDASGKMRADMLEGWSALQDPGQPLSPEISRLTGLTDEMLAGRAVDWQHVRDRMGRASVVIAHNAPFDRAFLKKRPELAGVNPHWACSVKHINWRKHGFRTRALNYLAADHGFVNPFAHRALFDCATTFRLVAPYMDELIRRSYLREFNVVATGAVFETKDILRQRGYRWNSETRLWSRQLLEDEMEEERQFLATEVYKGQPRHREDEITDGGVSG